MSCLDVESAQRCQSHTTIHSRVNSVALILTFELITSLHRNQRRVWVYVYICVCAYVCVCNSPVSTITIAPFEPPSWETTLAEQQVHLSQQLVAERRQHSLAMAVKDSKPGPSP